MLKRICNRCGIEIRGLQTIRQDGYILSLVYAYKDVPGSKKKSRETADLCIDCFCRLVVSFYSQKAQEGPDLRTFHDTP